MRSYPRNSPQAAARIVALALLADGNLCKSELEALERHGAHAQLGLSPAELHTVVHDLCQDLLAASDLAWGGSSQVDPRTLAGMLAEVQDPQLQLKVLQTVRRRRRDRRARGRRRIRGAGRGTDTVGPAAAAAARDAAGPAELLEHARRRHRRHG